MQGRTVHENAELVEHSRRAARLLRERDVWAVRAARILVWSLTLGSLGGALGQLMAPSAARSSLATWAAGATGLGILAAAFARWWSDNRGQLLRTAFSPGSLTHLALETGDFAFGLRAHIDGAELVLQKPGGLGYALRATLAVAVLGLFCLAAAVALLVTGASPILGIVVLLGPVIAVVWLRKPRLLRIAVVHAEAGLTAEVRTLRWGIAPGTASLANTVRFIDEGPGVLLAVAKDGSRLHLTNFPDDPWLEWEVNRLAVTLIELGHPVEVDLGDLPGRGGPFGAR